MHPAMFVTLSDKVNDPLQRILSTSGIHTLICDEAHHYLSEKKTQEYKAVSDLHTDRIVLLSGTVFRGDGESLENMMELVSGKFKLKKKRAYETFLQRDQASSSSSITKIYNLSLAVSNDRDIIDASQVLMILPDEYGMGGWPTKHEYIVYLNATDLQQQMLDTRNLVTTQLSQNEEDASQFEFGSQTNNTGSCTEYVQARMILGHPALKEKCLISSIDQSEKLQLLFHVLEQCKKDQEKVIIASFQLY